MLKFKFYIWVVIRRPLCKYALETGHLPVNIEQFSVLSDGLNNYKKRKLSEALFIEEQWPTLKKQGQSISLTLLN